MINFCLFLFGISGCPIFKDLEEPLEVNLSTSFTINAMWHSDDRTPSENNKTDGQIIFSISSKWFEKNSQVLYVPEGTKTKIKFRQTISEIENGVKVKR